MLRMSIIGHGKIKIGIKYGRLANKRQSLEQKHCKIFRLPLLHGKYLFLPLLLIRLISKTVKKFKTIAQLNRNIAYYQAN